MTRTLPLQAGVGLKAQHYNEILEHHPAIGWFEVHPENYMGAGGPPHHYLTEICRHYPLSMHGVGLSLGSAQGVSHEHLKNLKQLIERYQPAQVSEHLAWSHWNASYLNDLLPLPYTLESLALTAENIDKTQTSLGRTILIENPSTYIDFKTSDYSEPEFFRELSRISGCDILLDINNVVVSAHNNAFDPYEYIDTFPKGQVAEIHLAGYTVKPLTKTLNICIDDHGSEVKDAVWKLYQYFFTLEPRAVATLIEWDTNIPCLSTLLSEADRANQTMFGALEQNNRTPKPQ